MKPYTLSVKTRAALVPYVREFHGAVEVLANRTMGIDVEKPRGIGKFEGGVRVGDLEIAIYRDSVAEDWIRSPHTIPEEEAVAAALEALGAQFDEKGSAAFEGYPAMGVGLFGIDPLRMAILDFA